MTSELPPSLLELRSPRCIRERCGRILQAALAGDGRWFTVDLGRLDEVARATAEVTRERYPDLRVPPHSRFGHFDAGGVERRATVDAALADLDPVERARRLVDLVVVSVLVDAGAGPDWRYDDGSGGCLGRSEGLAVASLRWLEVGGLSSSREPFVVDASRLRALSEGELRAAFQVRADNPLVGLTGRLSLLRALGEAVETQSQVFGTWERSGGLVDGLLAQADEGRLPASRVLQGVLEGLGAIWPGRIERCGVGLGDVWPHPAAGGSGEGAGLVPLHKLSQWLTYSLLEPLEVAGLEITELNELTGLAEYRNGGLFIDHGVLQPRDPEVFHRSHDASSELVVEWRALTVALLDRLFEPVRERLGLDAADFPLAALLEGGTWAAGRRIARERRSDGGPPLRIRSDGTVF